MCVLSCFSRVWLCVTLWTVACQAPLSMGFSRQEYWSGLPCHTSGDLPNPGIKPMSLMSPGLATGFFTSSATWEALWAYICVCVCVCVCVYRLKFMFSESNSRLLSMNLLFCWELMSKFSSVQLLSCIRLFETPWTAAHQASLSITNSQTLLKLMSIESVMPSNHLILYRPLLLPSIFPSIRVFSNESVLLCCSSRWERLSRVTHTQNRRMHGPG